MIKLFIDIRNLTILKYKAINTTQFPRDLEFSKWINIKTIWTKPMHNLACWQKSPIKEDRGKGSKKFFPHCIYACCKLFFPNKIVSIVLLYYYWKFTIRMYHDCHKHISSKYVQVYYRFSTCESNASTVICDDNTAHTKKKNYNTVTTMETTRCAGVSVCVLTSIPHV